MELDKGFVWPHCEVQFDGNCKNVFCGAQGYQMHSFLYGHCFTYWQLKVTEEDLS